MRLTPAVAAAAFLFVSLARADEIPNPHYDSWSKFKPGTSITRKTTSTFGNTTSEVTATTTLIEVGADKLILEGSNVSKFGNMESKVPPMKADVRKTMTVPPEVAKKPRTPGYKPAGTVEEGTETLKIAGTTIKTKWYRYKFEFGGNTTEGKMWVSDDVPEGIVKAESTTTGKFPSKTKVELIKFKKP